MIQEFDATQGAVSGTLTQEWQVALLFFFSIQRHKASYFCLLYEAKLNGELIIQCIHEKYLSIISVATMS